MNEDKLKEAQRLMSELVECLEQEGYDQLDIVTAAKAFLKEVNS